MEVALIIRLYKIETVAEDAVYSTGLDFEVAKVGKEENVQPPLVLSLRLEKRRRQVALHLISGIKWTLYRKQGNYIEFRAEVPPQIWKAFQTLCNAKYRLTKERFERWMNMTPEELVEEFKIIEMVNVLDKEKYA